LLLLLQTLSLNLLLLEPLLIVPLALILMVSFCLILGVYSPEPILDLIFLQCSCNFAFTSQKLLTVNITAAAKALEYGRISTNGTTMRMHCSAWGLWRWLRERRGLMRVGVWARMEPL
jgi:hypothetical protein